VSGPRPWLPFAAAGACAVGLGVVAVLALHSGAGQARDVAILHGFTGLDRPRVSDGLEVLGRSVDPLPYALGGLACIAVAVSRGLPWRAATVAVVLVGTGATAQVLKHALAEQRFAPWLRFDQIDAASFPSGHATAAMTLALCAIMVTPPAWRALTALLAGGYAVGVAYATLALSWHYPSDVLAGFLLAGLWVSLAVAAVRRIEPAAAEPPGAVPRETLVLLGAIGTVVAAVVVGAASDGVAPYATQRPAVVVAAATIAVLALGLAATVVAAD
jgi:membrane-associated phospholipid phosphatase